MPTRTNLRWIKSGCTQPTQNEPHFPEPKPAANNYAFKPIDGSDFETVRIKDDDLDPALYDPDSGEYFLRPPPPARNQRQAADAWVAAALMTV